MGITSYKSAFPAARLCEPEKESKHADISGSNIKWR